MFRLMIASGLLAALFQFNPVARAQQDNPPAPDRQSTPPPAAGRQAPDRGERPQGPPPSQVVVSAENNQLLVPYVVQDFRREQRTRTVTDNNGQRRQERYTVTVPHFKEEVMRIDLNKVKAATASGQAVDSRDLADRLRRPTHVLISADGRKVDPFYLHVIKPDVLVLVLPAPKAPPDERLPSPGNAPQGGSRAPSGRQAPPPAPDRRQPQP